jgi:flavin reductase (DIM6/NTAB) family NADH-FMN oxidoreductase RutF
LDQKVKKDVLRKFVYGVYVLVVKYKNEFSAATVTWLSQASFEPPLVMIGLNIKSNTYRLVNKSGKFSINILNEDQKKMAAAFFKESNYENQKINGYEIKIKNSEIPIFDNVNASLECEIFKLIEIGDHNIIVAKIINAQEFSKKSVLDLKATGWKYGG